MGKAFFCEQGLSLDELHWRRDEWGCAKFTLVYVDGEPYKFVQRDSAEFIISQYGPYWMTPVPGDLLLAAARVMELTKGKMVEIIS